MSMFLEPSYLDPLQWSQWEIEREIRADKLYHLMWLRGQQKIQAEPKFDPTDIDGDNQPLAETPHFATCMKGAVDMAEDRSHGSEPLWPGPFGSNEDQESERTKLHQRVDAMDPVVAPDVSYTVQAIYCDECEM